VTTERATRGIITTPPAEKSFERVSGADPFPARRGREEAAPLTLREFVSAAVSGEIPERRKRRRAVRMSEGRSGCMMEKEKRESGRE
jgi:hypothetical protein